MTIVIDTHIPFFVEAVQKEWPDVDIYPMESEEIDSSAVRNADILVVRTRNQINESLLAGSKVKMVCTATIGFDHIDTAYCESHGIRWTACPGCNAKAVCDYVEEAIKEVQATGTIGIVGVGHVGSLVAQMAEKQGLNVLLNDPPKNIGVSLDEIAEKCNIITFHVPLNDTTYHMCGEAFLAKCRRDTLIINAARGGVVDEQALLRSGLPFIIDTWENEPNINEKVVAKALRASMHIAGYSIEGKRNATQMCLDAISEQFGLPKIQITKSRDHEIATNNNNSSEPWLAAISKALKASPTSFEALRKVYPLRGE